MIDEMIESAIERSTAKSFTLENAEQIAFARFEEKIISIEQASIILNVHPDTVRNYIKYYGLETEPRVTERSPYKFRMSDVLKFRKPKK